MKLSLITDQNGIPLNDDLYKGNCNDANIFKNQLIKLDTTRFNKKNTIFWLMLAMTLKKLREELNKKFYKYIIPFNKRKTKDKN